MPSANLLAKGVQKVAIQIAEDGRRSESTVNTVTAAGAGTTKKGSPSANHEDSRTAQHKEFVKKLRDTSKLSDTACIKCGKEHGWNRCPNLGEGCSHCNSNKHTIDVCFQNFNAKPVSPPYCKQSYPQPSIGGTKKTFLGERKKQPRVMNYKSVVLLDSGCNVPVMSPFLEDFSELRGGAGQSIIGTSVVPVDGVGRFLGTIEGIYSPQSTTQSAIIAETMLEVLEYRIERRNERICIRK